VPVAAAPHWASLVNELLAFVAVAAVVIVMPGQDTALTIRNTIAGGRRAGAGTAAGVAAGQAVWTLATSAGLAAVLVASEPAFLAVKLVGAAYLVVLGVQALRDALRPAATRPHVAGHARSSPGRAFRQGLLSNLGNPKMAVFFSSLLPQFAPGGEASFLGLAALGLAFCAMTLVWLMAYAAAVARAGDLLRRARVRRALDGVTGAVLVAFGVRLAAESR
jgi:threonine/homoserine/homoserine lactone efflux protein